MIPHNTKKNPYTKSVVVALQLLIMFFWILSVCVFMLLLLFVHIVTYQCDLYTNEISKKKKENFWHPVVAAIILTSFEKMIFFCLVFILYVYLNIRDDRLFSIYENEKTLRKEKLFFRDSGKVCIRLFWGKSSEIYSPFFLLNFSNTKNFRFGSFSVA